MHQLPDVMPHKNIWDYQYATEVLNILAIQPHVFVDCSLKYRLQILNALVQVISLCDIQIAILNGVPEDILLITMQSQGFSSNEYRPLGCVSGLCLLEVYKRKLIKPAIDVWR